MTTTLRLPKWLTDRRRRLPYIKQLNTLLKLAYTDLRALDDAAWRRFLDDLHVALYGAKRNAKDKESIFAKVATRPAVWDALGELRKRLDRAEGSDGPFEFPLREQTMTIVNRDDGYHYTFASKDLATMIYMQLAHLLNISLVQPGEFRKCENKTCKTPFIPSRRPRPGVKVYCDNRCARVVAARMYRERARRKAAAG